MPRNSQKSRYRHKSSWMNQELLVLKPSRPKQLMNLREAMRLVRKVCQSIDSLKDTLGAAQSPTDSKETMFPCRLKMSCSKSKETPLLVWATLNSNIRETRPIHSILQCLWENCKIMFAPAWCSSGVDWSITRKDRQRWDRRIRQNNSRCLHKWNIRHESNLNKNCSSRSRKERLTYKNFNYSINNNRYRPSPASTTRHKLKCLH